MKLNPLDIYNKEFKNATFGYNKDQVDNFLDDVGVAYERLLKDLNKLQQENEDLKEKMERQQDLESKLQKTLDSMQQTISKRIEQADQEARMIVKEARMKAENIKEEAQAEVVDEKRKFEQLREQKRFFKIRFKTLLESHLGMLDDEDENSFTAKLSNSSSLVDKKEINENDDSTPKADQSN